jgi:hypothetical protein
MFVADSCLKIGSEPSRFSNCFHHAYCDSLMWEILTYGRVPYGAVGASDVIQMLLAGERLAKPTNCPQDLYVSVSCHCFSFALSPLLSVENRKSIACLVSCDVRRYVLMMCCWALDPAARPSFRDIRSSLVQLSPTPPAHSVTAEAEHEWMEIQRSLRSNVMPEDESVL